MANQPDISPEQRKALRKKRRLRRRILRTVTALTILLILLVVVALVVIRITGTIASKSGATTSFLAVKVVNVEGETRYASDDLIRASGIYVGESLLAVNKVQAHDNLLRQFPYLELVDVGNTAFDTVCIRVQEATVMGAAQTGEGWLITGTNNRGLELTSEENLPQGCLRVIGATFAEDSGVGGTVFDERSLRISTTLTDAIAANGLEKVVALDMTEKTNIGIRWNNQIDVVLGNETNLVAEIQALTRILPELLKNNGDNAAGRLDMSSYADDDSSNDRAIFTPADVLAAQQSASAAAPAATEPAA